MAKKLKIVLIQEYRKWDNEEEEFLKEYWGKYPVAKIARKLKRTEMSVIKKAYKLKLGPMLYNDYENINVLDIANIFKIGSETVYETWAKYGLNIQKINLTPNFCRYCVSYKDLMVFLEHNQDLWDSRLLEENILGEEPKWLLQKRRRDYLNDFTKKPFWTEEEDQIIIEADGKLSIKELAETKLSGRTNQAIYHERHKLKLKRRL